MSLEEIVDNTRTDKNTVHSYLPLYQKLLERKKETARNVLEVGIYLGGSIRLWSDFFTNATVHGLDIGDENTYGGWDDINNKDNIVLYSSTDAYDEDLFTRNFLDKGIKCDFMLDDGPHHLDKMVKFIKMYSQIMTDDGILIIEDIQEINWVNTLSDNVPDELKPYIKIFDLRYIKGRHDDIVFVIDKLNV
jgi:hypothetical protein